jgi:hypothetical protein
MAAGSADPAIPSAGDGNDGGVQMAGDAVKTMETQCDGQKCRDYDPNTDKDKLVGGNTATKGNGGKFKSFKNNNDKRKKNHNKKKQGF